MIGVEIKGIDEAKMKLKLLPERLGRNVIRQANRKALKPVHQAAKKNALTMIGKGTPGHMGTLISKNIIIKAPKKQKPGHYKLMVTIRKGMSEFTHYTKGSASSITGKRKLVAGSRYFIPAAIEYGFAKAGEGGSKNKHVPARPFMRAASIHFRKSTQIFINQLKSRIALALK